MKPFKNLSPDDRINPAEREAALGHDPVARRSLDIARSEGKSAANIRSRFRKEPWVPDEIIHASEASAKLDGEEPWLWDELPEIFGGLFPKGHPDNSNIGKELVEKGLHGPDTSRYAAKAFPT